MPRLDLSRVETACRKPSCGGTSGTLHRHHKGHEALFVRWFRLTRADSKRYKAFKARYDSFHQNDVILICDRHHQEIHLIYRHIIREHLRRVKTPLMHWSWKQARILMADLRAECDRWLLQETPGVEWQKHDESALYSRMDNFVRRRS